MARKKKQPSTPPPALPAAQVVLVNPGTLCGNCRLPLHGTGYLSRKEVVCSGCLKFLETLEKT